MNLSRLHQHLAILILAILTATCANRKIEYSLKHIEPREDERLKNVVLSVEIFDDKRSAYDANKVLFKSAIKHNEKERAWYFNLEKKYREPVPSSLAAMFAAHLQKRGAFAAVKFNTKDSAHYYLKGSVHYFYAAQFPGKTRGLLAASYILPPLAIPMLAIALWEKSRAVMTIELKDLAIYDRHGKIASFDLARKYDKRCRSWYGRKAVYRNLNLTLAEYFEEVAPIVEKEIRTAEGG